MIKIISFLALLSIVNAGQQFVVKGRVVDRNGSPLSSTYIRMGNNANDSATTKADTRGYFTISLPSDEPKYLYFDAGEGYRGNIPMLPDSDNSVTITICLDTVNQLSFQFADSGSRTAKFPRLHLDLSQDYMNFVQSLQRLQRDSQDTRSFLIAWMDSANNLKQRIVTENDPILRGECLLRYYRLTSIQGMTFDSLFYKQNVASIPVSSPLWFFNNYEAYDQTSTRSGGSAFVDSIIEYHPSRELRAFLLFQRAMEAQSATKENEVRQNYKRLKEEFPDIWWSRIADQWIVVDMKVRRGTQIPDFSFKDMDDSTIVYSNSSLKGNIFLLDFWATWCLPCIGEIPYLQKAYEKYHSKGLQIISISSGTRQSDVKTFREHKANMPWTHVWLSESELKMVHDQFEITGIPKPILVDRDGLIVGLKSEVRGENLERVLEKLFGE